MTTKREAEIKIAAAEKACSKVQTEASAAFAALNRGLSVNGYGIYHDRFAVRNNLQEAKAHIQEALNALNDIDWPTNAEYDLV